MKNIPFFSVLPETLTQPATHRGEIIQLHYTAHAYFPDSPSFGKEYSKSVHVYLPFGYDRTCAYNSVYILHGGGGDDYHDWLSEKNPDPVDLLENLVRLGYCTPCILIFPNGRAAPEHFEGQQAYHVFYEFGHEIRNELIPFIEKKFPVRRTRESRAICGLSMGGFQTGQIGVGELYDLFSGFGMFSASFNGGNGMTFSADKALKVISNQGAPALLYMACGTDDVLCYGTYCRDRDILRTGLSASPELCEGENLVLQDYPGCGHSHAVWKSALVNFLSHIFIP